MAKILHEHIRMAKTPCVEAIEPVEVFSKPSTLKIRDKSGRSRKFSLRRVGYTLLFGICALASVGVPMNALFFQDTRHPAPMFLTNSLIPKPSRQLSGNTTAAHTVDPPLTTIEGPKSTVETGNKTAKYEPTRKDVISKTKIHANSAKKTIDAPKVDPIAELIASPSGLAMPEQSDVLMAQQALLKLGYVVRADGKFTKATQKAIEKFEHDNGLPVKGLLTTRIAAILANRAGLETE